MQSTCFSFFGCTTFAGDNLTTKATGDRIQAEAIKQADLLSCLPTVCCHHPDTILAKHSISSSSTKLEEESLILSASCTYLRIEWQISHKKSRYVRHAYSDPS